MLIAFCNVGFFGTAAIIAGMDVDRDEKSGGIWTPVFLGVMVVMLVTQIMVLGGGGWRKRPLGQNFEAAGDLDGLLTLVGAQLAEDRRHVRFHRRDRNIHLIGDLLVQTPGGETMQDAHLRRGQLGDFRRRLRRFLRLGVAAFIGRPDIAIEHGGQRLDELVHAGGLGNEARRAKLQRPRGDAGRLAGGDHHHRRAGMALA